MSVSWSAICAWRLHRHFLDTATATPAEVTAAMCGAHAQVLAAAEVSVALRTGGTAAQVRGALWDEHALVKTFGPRGSVHLLPTRDLPLWTGALAAVPHRSAMPRGVGLSPDQAEESVGAIADALAGAELTVDELTGAIVARVGAWAGDPVMPAFRTFWPRWRQITAHAAHRGALCFGPNRGRQVTYPARGGGCPASSPPTRTPRSTPFSPGTCTPTDPLRRRSSPAG
ncbi:hypothetical protein FB470_006029 [Amycolatopsis thermophila]|uniref:Winged helix DNA-binding domain-containing protein n=1 Tax=Amycolatopsis thermophila TaxID=206084 RepID=A0ABU0F384_9PSEU|nr:crosslink repair DNA glycosylase YcaQ family protein [Amycolatopsis thermophila]MDQ0382035.1 hypothetical protein [Amycolatopsis thermophila]